jgi:DNA-binding GntR family transcriptional regulator
MGLYTYLMDLRRKAVSQPGATLGSYKDHTDIVAGLRARDRSAVVAAFDRHLDRIYTTTRSILDSM